MAERPMKVSSETTIPMEISSGVALHAHEVDSKQRLLSVSRNVDDTVAASRTEQDGHETTAADTKAAERPIIPMQDSSGVALDEQSTDSQLGLPSVSTKVVDTVTASRTEQDGPPPPGRPTEEGGKWIFTVEGWKNTGKGITEGELTENDVLSCGHIRNTKYAELINQFADEYSLALIPSESNVIGKIVKLIQSANGRFLEKHDKSGLWYEISEEKSAQMVCEALEKRVHQEKKKQNRGVSSIDPIEQQELKGYQISEECVVQTVHKAPEARVQREKEKLDHRVSSVGPNREECVTDNDILAKGTGNGYTRHAGYEYFRSLIRSNAVKYGGPKKNKKKVVNKVLDAVRAGNGHFLKWDKGRGLWIEMDESQAYAKTRDALQHEAKMREGKNDGVSSIEPIGDQHVSDNDVLSDSPGYCDTRHAGTEFFRNLTRLKAVEYNGTNKKKKNVIEEVLEAVRARNGRFLKWDGLWIEMNEFEAHEKTRCALYRETKKREGKNALADVSTLADTRAIAQSPSPEVQHSVNTIVIDLTSGHDELPTETSANSEDAGAGRISTSASTKPSLSCLQKAHMGSVAKKQSLDATSRSTSAASGAIRRPSSSRAFVPVGGPTKHTGASGPIVSEPSKISRGHYHEDDVRHTSSAIREEKLEAPRLPQNAPTASGDFTNNKKSVGSAQMSTLAREEHRARQSQGPSERGLSFHELNDFDVLTCAQADTRHAGTLKFRTLIGASRPKYQNAVASQDMISATHIAEKVVDRVHAEGGRFLTMDKRTGLWHPLSAIGALKNTLHTFQSSTKEKAANEDAYMTSDDTISVETLAKRQPARTRKVTVAATLPHKVPRTRKQHPTNESKSNDNAVSGDPPPFFSPLSSKRKSTEHGHKSGVRAKRQAVKPRIEIGHLKFVGPCKPDRVLSTPRSLEQLDAESAAAAAATSKRLSQPVKDEHVVATHEKVNSSVGKWKSEE